MAEHLREPAALSEDLSSDPKALTGQLTTRVTQVP